MWDTALDIAATGTSVVLDWNFWSREQRQDASDRAGTAGCPLIVHDLAVPLETAIARAEARAGSDTPDVHLITADGLRHFATILERPTPDEGLEVETHHDSQAP